VTLLDEGDSDDEIIGQAELDPAIFDDPDVAAQ
jgi:hypothetical protein